MRHWKRIHTDSALWVAIGTLSAMQAGLTTDEAYKYANPYLLFWTKWTIMSLNGGCMALKMYRSTGFAKSLSANPNAS